VQLSGSMGRGVLSGIKIVGGKLSFQREERQGTCFEKNFLKS